MLSSASPNKQKPLDDMLSNPLISNVNNTVVENHNEKRDSKEFAK